MNIELDRIVEISREAGKAIMEIYSRDFDIVEKEDKSPLTEADLAAHGVIVDALKKLDPELPILSEESAKIPFEERAQWQRYWLVDPLDGTREFIKRNGEFTVNIALIDSGRAVCGAVHVPARDTSYYGCIGEGAWKIEGNAPAEPISVASERHTPLRVAGSRSHAGDSLKRFLEKVGPHEIVSMGSSLKLCLVAEGEADIYPRLGPTSEWDTAAAQAVVEAAGGTVTDVDMQPLRYNHKESLLNPYFLVFADGNENWSDYLS